MTTFVKTLAVTFDRITPGYEVIMVPSDKVQKKLYMGYLSSNANCDKIAQRIRVTKPMTNNV